MRRGSILLAVMLVVMMGALAAAVVLRATRATRMTAAVSLRQTELRSLAWSGVLGVMSELQGQRDRLLEGGSPSLTDGWVAHEEGGRRAIVRLVPMGAGLCEGECGKLDLNRVDCEWLTPMTQVGEALATKIESERTAWAVGSVDELTRLGVDPVDLRRVGRGEEGGETPPHAGLVELLTTFAIDSNEGPDGPRVCVCGEISEADCHRLNDMSGADVCAMLKAHADAGNTIKSEADLLGVLVAGGLSGANLAAAFDRLCVTQESTRYGRVDLSSASAEVLARVSGINTDLAARIVAARDRTATPGDTRASVLWPVVDGLVDIETYRPCVDHLTARSLVWRFRVEAGLERKGSTDSGTRSGDLAGAELTDRVRLEAVVDLSAREPRVAYLRDVTHLELAQLLPLPSVRDPEPAALAVGAAAEAPVSTEEAPSADAAPVTRDPMGSVSRWRTQNARSERP